MHRLLHWKVRTGQDKIEIKLYLKYIGQAAVVHEQQQELLPATSCATACSH
jgi:hypothetical protein